MNKPKRYKSKENLKKVRTLPCMICLRRPVDVDHWVTRGAGGGDNMSNLSPLCRTHHIEKHSIGVKEFYRRFHTVIYENRKLLELPNLKRKGEEES